MTASFTALGLSKALTDNLERINISEPTPVQAEAIPVVMEGRDLIATAPTGTGKTGAFLLPVLERLVSDPKPGRGPRVLVLSPTRELAAQIGKAAKGFSEGVPRAKTVTITGGESYQQQNRVLSRPYEILIATPGRLLDQLSSDRIDLSRVEVLILDEADRMLDIGFTDAVLEIAGKIPEQHQTLCFTATMSDDVVRLSEKLLKDPHRIDVGGETHTRANITQRLIYVDGLEHKHQLLRHWVTHEDTGQVIVFTATKRDADELAEALAADGLPAIALHGDLTQRARTRSLNQLRSGEARILIATDVAARGIDVSGISHVINFDLPKFAEDYVHRIGRTGRAGAEGIAVSFVGRQDVGALKRIERFVGNPIEETKVEGMEAKFRPDPRGPRREGRFNDRRGGGGQRRDGQRRDGQGRDGGGFRNRNNRGEGRGENRGNSQGRDNRGENRGNRSQDDRQPRFGGDNGQRNWRGDRPQRSDRPQGQGQGQRPPRNDRQQNRGPRDDNFGNRGPRDDNFGNRGPREDRQPFFGDDDRQPDFGGEPAPHYYDERQPDSNDNRKPAFDVARRGRRTGGGNGGGSGGGNNGGGNGNRGDRAQRGNRSGGKGKGQGGGQGGHGKVARKPRDGQGQRGGARGGQGGAGGQRGRRQKQVGLYLPETPVKRADWRNERLTDTPKKPKIIKKGENARSKGEEGGNNTWSFTGRTLRLKRKTEGDE
ncbi:MAG: DEAD/DEAH box helicase [Pseudomonadota bacterium]